MENVMFTQLSVSEIRTIITEVVEGLFLKHNAHKAEEEEKDIMLNVREACKLIQVAPPTIYRYTSKKIIPHIKKGKKLLFVKAEILAWLKEGKRTSVAELSKRENFFTLNTRKKPKA